MSWPYEWLEVVTIFTPRNLENLRTSFRNTQWKGTTMTKNGQCKEFKYWASEDLKIWKLRVKKVGNAHDTVTYNIKWLVQYDVRSPKEHMRFTSQWLTFHNITRDIWQYVIGGICIELLVILGIVVFTSICANMLSVDK